MNLLALDIGMRRTGIAYADTTNGIVLPLDTFTHATPEELVARVQQLSTERKIDEIVIGLPLLLSGEEGEQAKFVRACGTLLETLKIPLFYLDERYSTPSGKGRVSDPDAAAACGILQMYIDRKTTF